MTQKMTQKMKQKMKTDGRRTRCIPRLGIKNYGWPWQGPAPTSAPAPTPTPTPAPTSAPSTAPPSTLSLFHQSRTSTATHSRRFALTKGLSDNTSSPTLSSSIHRAILHKLRLKYSDRWNLRQVLQAWIYHQCYATTQDNSRRRLALSTLAWHVLVTSVETL